MGVRRFRNGAPVCMAELRRFESCDCLSRAGFLHCPGGANWTVDRPGKPRQTSNGMSNRHVRCCALPIVAV